MKVLIWGGEARYRADLPRAVQSLPLELVFCPREQPLGSMLPQHADTVFLFVDAIAPVDGALMDRMPGLRLIHSEGVAYNAIDLEAARRRSIFVCNNKGCNAAPTAEMAVMLMLMSLRFGIPGDRAVREGRQIRFKEGIMAAGGPELGERTMGKVMQIDEHAPAAVKEALDKKELSAGRRRWRPASASPICLWRSCLPAAI